MLLSTGSRSVASGRGVRYLCGHANANANANAPKSPLLFAEATDQDLYLFQTPRSTSVNQSSASVADHTPSVGQRVAATEDSAWRTSPQPRRNPGTMLPIATTIQTKTDPRTVKPRSAPRPPMDHAPARATGTTTAKPLRRQPPQVAMTAAGVVVTDTGGYASVVRH